MSTEHLLKAVADELQHRMVDEIKQLYKDVAVETYDGKTPNPVGRDYAARLLSPKVTVDEGQVRIGPALLPRVYYATVAVVLAELITRGDEHGTPSMIQAGVWIDKKAFNIEFFAWVEVYIPKVNA